MRVDLNADVGEGLGQDPALMPVITSANVACGYHAGDVETMRTTVALAQQHGVAVGAHPSFDDRDHFGRQEMRLAPDEVTHLVERQVVILRDVAAAAGAALRHVKPHGALYNMAARDRDLADAIARAVARVDPDLIVFGLAGSESIAAATRAGLRTASEVFADRAYHADGRLVSRSTAGAVIDDPAIVIPRTLAMVRDQAVTSIEGARVPLQVDTICVHGDTPGAAAIAARLHRALVDAGITVAVPAIRP